MGLAATAALTLSIVAATRADADLRATGVHTTGTVLDVDPDSKSSPGGAEVSFEDESGAVQMTYVPLDAYADDFEAGQHVEVIYDPADWSHITLDDAPWTPPDADAAQGLLLFPAGLGLILGALLVWIRSRTRRLLAGRAWTPVRVTVQRSRGRHFSTEDDGYWESYVAGRWPGTAEEHDAWWVTDGRRAVFSPTHGGPLVLARRR